MLAESADRLARDERRAPLARRFPVSRSASTSSSRPGSRCCTARTGRARRACSKRSAGSRAPARSAASPTRCSCARARPGDRARRGRRPANAQQLFEAEIRVDGPQPRSCATSKPVARARDLHGLLRVTVFAPDDLALVKGGPAGAARRTSTSSSAMLAARYDAARTDFERVLKQRNALLRGGVRDDDARDDARRVRRATRARGAPSSCGAGCGSSSGWCPAVDAAYAALAGDAPAGRRDVRSGVGAGAARATADADDVEDLLRRRARARAGGPRSIAGSRSSARTATTGSSTIGGLDARTQASQGEQRTLALALRLAGHEVVHELTGARAGAAARRRVQRARRARARRARAQPAAGPDAAHDRGRGAAGRRRPNARLRVARGRVDRGAST